MKRVIEQFAIRMPDGQLLLDLGVDAFDLGPVGDENGEWTCYASHEAAARKFGDLRIKASNLHMTAEFNAKAEVVVRTVEVNVGQWESAEKANVPRQWKTAAEIPPNVVFRGVGAISEYTRLYSKMSINDDVAYDFPFDYSWVPLSDLNARYPEGLIEVAADAAATRKGLQWPPVGAADGQE